MIYYAHDAQTEKRRYFSIDDFCLSVLYMLL